MKHLLTLTLAVLTALTATATQPLRRGFMKHQQSDGTTIEVRRVGNAQYSFYVSRDGLALVRDAQGDFRYATSADDGLAATSLAHEKDLRTTAEVQSALTAEAADDLLMTLHPTTLTRMTRATATTADGLGAYGTPSNGTVSSIGAPVIPVVMAEFSDRSFQDTITIDKLTRWLNEEGYSDEKNCVGSVRDYFISQSGGLFTPSFKVVGKVKLSRGYAYYGANSSSGSNDVNKYIFVQEVLDSACAAGVDFTDFATDNGRVPNVSIFYAGPGEHSAYEPDAVNYLWAHFSTRTFTTTTGVHINSYFIGDELLQGYRNANGEVEYSDEAHNYPIPQSAEMDGIGVYCHEFSHALGLPDFYYTGSNATITDTLRTMWYWSIMDYGQYVSNGYAPVGYNAYERSFMGWLNIEDLTEAEAGNYTLAAFDAESDTPKAYCIRNASNSSEYYLLENRQPSTWYPKRMGSGMLITHVDYLASAWSANTVNNTPSHQRFSYVPADNEKEEDADGKQHFRDLYPYTGTDSITRDEFTDTSVPASTVFTGTTLGKPIYGIKAGADGLVTFTYLDKSLTPIHTVKTDAVNVRRTVYTLDGRRVTTLTEAESTNALPAGLYLVGSGSHYEKVLVK